MIRCTGACATLLLAALLAAPSAHAQDPETRMPRRGMLELGATGTYTQYEALFDDGGRRPLTAALLPPLQAAIDRVTAPRVAGARDALAAFFAGTGGVPAGVDPSAAGIGELRMAAAADVRTLPLTLSYGVTDWLAVGVTVPLERRETAVLERHLAGGTLGINPDSILNAAILERIGEPYGALGRSAFFPTRGSPLGVALQQRVHALLGDTVQLSLAEFPLLVDAVGGGGLTLTPEELAALALESPPTRYRVGDVQPAVRIRLLRGPAEWEGAGAGGPSLRSTLGVRGRIPVGPRTGGEVLLEIPSEHGHAGWGVDLANELFLTRRLTVGATAQLEVRLPANVQRRAFTAENPIPADTALRIVRREPGARLALALSPRYRLTEEISLAARYGLLRQGETRFTGAEGILPGPAEAPGPWTAHAVGFGARYSTLAAYEAGRTGVPVEVSLVFENTVSGSGGAPAARRVHVTGRLFAPVRLLGRLIAATPDETPEEDDEPADPALPGPTGPATPPPPVEPPAG